MDAREVRVGKHSEEDVRLAFFRFVFLVSFLLLVFPFCFGWHSGMRDLRFGERMCLDIREGYGGKWLDTYIIIHILHGGEFFFLGFGILLCRRIKDGWIYNQNVYEGVQCCIDHLYVNELSAGFWVRID